MNQMVVKWNSCTKFWILSCSSFPIFSRWNGTVDFTFFHEVSSATKKRLVAWNSHLLRTLNSQLYKCKCFSVENALQLLKELSKEAHSWQNWVRICEWLENKEIGLGTPGRRANWGSGGGGFRSGITWAQARTVHWLKKIRDNNPVTKAWSAFYGNCVQALLTMLIIRCFSHGADGSHCPPLPWYTTLGGAF